MITVSDLQREDKLLFRKGDYNIIDCGIRTGKTFWAMNNLAQFTRDGAPERILYLVNTNALKEQLLVQYPDCCTEANEYWREPDSWGEKKDKKIGVMCYQTLGTLFLKEKASFLDNIDVICWDECDSVFDFAAQAFVTARKTDFARQSMSNAEVLAIIQKYSTNKDYMPLVLLGEWEKIIETGRIMCIGLSASPQRTYQYYKSLVSASYQGTLEAGYRMADDIYFCDIFEHVKTLIPEPGRGYWCYSPLIEPNKRLVEVANACGFKAIELHSLTNEKKPMTEEQKRVYNMIVTTGMVPLEYDFVIVNKALERGITIIDKRFSDSILNTVNRNERIQGARQAFYYRRHVKILAPAIPNEFLNRWLTVAECRELAAYMGVPEKTNHNNSRRIMTWNKLKDNLSAFGYTVQKKRKTIDGNVVLAYYITGEWNDVEVQDNDFMSLVEAKEEE